MKVAVYDAKQYDSEFLLKASGAQEIQWVFHSFPLGIETLETAKGVEAICVFVNDEVDADCMKTLSGYGVKYIALRCSGYNNIDIEAAHHYKIAVTRVPAYSPHAVAEHTVGLLLALNRKIPRAYNRVREMNFSLNGLVGFDLAGKTIGVIGTGRIGKIFAHIMKGFETNVLVYDPKPSFEWAQKEGITYVDPLDVLLAKSDVISLHMPLLPSTLHLIDREAIRKMKHGVLLINASRGKVVDTAALIEGLKTGQIGGVALDTYEEEEGVFFEDLSDRILMDDELSRLLTFPNVLITAHQAFLTKEALGQIASTTVTNLLNFEKKSPFLPETEL